MSRRACAGALALAAVVACGGGQTRVNLFSTDWEDDGGASIARVWQRAGGSPVPANAQIALGIGGDANRLVGVPLDGGARWTFDHPVDSRPVVTASVVVGSGDGEIFALDAVTGRPMWRRPSGGLPMVGAGDGGAVTVVVLRRPGGTGSVLLAVTHDGQVVRQIETPRALGAPAVLDRLAFVPWAGQYVSVLDLSDGDETARVTLRDETNRAWAQGGSIWFGGVGFTRFDERIRDASKGKASRVVVPSRQLPGAPRLVPPGTAPEPALAGANDRVRAYAMPSTGEGGAAIQDRRWYTTYFRLAMGFQSDSRKLSWVRVNGPSFVGGAAEAGGLLLCDEGGKITEIDGATGGTIAMMDFGEPVKSCVVSVDARRASGPPDAAKGMAAQLTEAVLTEDPQLVATQRMLLKEMAASPDETVTRALIELASDPRTSPDLLGDARAALAERRTGASYMLAALGRHYDFLKDVLRPPPVGPLAHALAAMKERSAAPLLASHLLDPADTEEDVRETAAALAVIGTTSELPALRQFFAMYRATAMGDEMPVAVARVAEALMRLDVKSGRTTVEAASKDGMTSGDVRDRLAAMLAAPAQPVPAAQPGQPGQPVSAD
jgi:outer membrane protein assembly factor BamB